MLSVFIRAHGDMKVGDRKEFTAAEFVPLADAGLVITATEWDANERVKATEAAARQRVEAQATSEIKVAIVQAKDRGAIAPKDTKAEEDAIAKARALDFKPEAVELIKASIGALKGEEVSTTRRTTSASEPMPVVIVGDGGLQMNIQELAALAERNLPVKILLLNNRRLGIVSQFQRIEFSKFVGIIKPEQFCQFIGKQIGKFQCVIVSIE